MRAATAADRAPGRDAAVRHHPGDRAREPPRRARRGRRAARAERSGQDHAPAHRGDGPVPHVRQGGQSWASTSTASARRSVSRSDLLSHRTRLYEDLTAAENLAFWCRLLGLDAAGDRRGARARRHARGRGRTRPRVLAGHAATDRRRANDPAAAGPAAARRAVHRTRRRGSPRGRRPDPRGGARRTHGASWRRITPRPRHSRIASSTSTADASSGRRRDRSRGGRRQLAAVPAAGARDRGQGPADRDPRTARARDAAAVRGHAARVVRVRVRSGPRHPRADRTGSVVDGDALRGRDGGEAFVSGRDRGRRARGTAPRPGRQGRRVPRQGHRGGARAARARGRRAAHGDRALRPVAREPARAPRRRSRSARSGSPPSAGCSASSPRPSARARPCSRCSCCRSSRRC